MTICNRIFRRGLSAQVATKTIPVINLQVQVTGEIGPFQDQFDKTVPNAYQMSISRAVLAQLSFGISTQTTIVTTSSSTGYKTQITTALLIPSGSTIQQDALYASLTSSSSAAQDFINQAIKQYAGSKSTTIGTAQVDVQSVKKISIQQATSALPYLDKYNNYPSIILPITFQIDSSKISKEVDYATNSLSNDIAYSISQYIKLQFGFYGVMFIIDVQGDSNSATITAGFQFDQYIVSQAQIPAIYFATNDIGQFIDSAITKYKPDTQKQLGSASSDKTKIYYGITQPISRSNKGYEWMVPPIVNFTATLTVPYSTFNNDKALQKAYTDALVNTLQCDSIATIVSIKEGSSVVATSVQFAQVQEGAGTSLYVLLKSESLGSDFITYAIQTSNSASILGTAMTDPSTLRTSGLTIHTDAPSTRNGAINQIHGPIMSMLIGLATIILVYV